MSESWFVRPKEIRLPLSDGQWISVRQRLTAGEQHDAEARLYEYDEAGNRRVNLNQIHFSLMLAYVVDWSIVDDEGAPVPIRGLSVADLTTTLRALDPLRFREIREAIDAHVTAMFAERAAEKKTATGATRPDATSSSPSAVTGGSTGSVN